MDAIALVDGGAASRRRSRHLSLRPGETLTSTTSFKSGGGSNGAVGGLQKPTSASGSRAAGASSTAARTATVGGVSGLLLQAPSPTRGGGAASSSPSRRSALPKRTLDQLMQLYLKYDGLTRDKLPNLVAELNLTIPVGFDLRPFFGLSGDESSSDDDVLVEGDPSCNRKVGSNDIIQPEQLCALVEHLQSAAGGPSSSSVLHTVQVLTGEGDLLDGGDHHSASSSWGGGDLSAQATSANLSSAAANSPSMSMAASTRGHFMSGVDDGFAGIDAAAWSGRGPPKHQPHPDFIDRASVEAALRRFFASSDSCRAAVKAVFSDASPSLVAVEAAPAPPTGRRNTNASAAATSSIGKAPVRQSVEQFRRFLEEGRADDDDDPIRSRLMYAFRRCGAVDDGSGALTLSVEALTSTCQQRQLNTLMGFTNAVSEALDPDDSGEVDSPMFETVAIDSLVQSAKRAAAITHAVGAIPSNTAAAPAGNSSPSSGGASSSSGGAAAAANAGPVTGGGAAGAATVSPRAAGLNNNANGVSTGANGVTSPGAITAASSAAAADAAALSLWSYGAAGLTSVALPPPPVALLMAVVAPQIVVDLVGRVTLQWLLQFHKHKRMTQWRAASTPRNGGGFQLPLIPASNASSNTIAVTATVLSPATTTIPTPATSSIVSKSTFPTTSQSQLPAPSSARLRDAVVGNGGATSVTAVSSSFDGTLSSVPRSFTIAIDEEMSGVTTLSATVPHPPPTRSRAASLAGQEASHDDERHRRRIVSAEAAAASAEETAVDKSLPRYLQQAHHPRDNDIICCAVRDRVAQRKLLDEQRAASAQAEQRTIALRLARLVSRNMHERFGTSPYPPVRYTHRQQQQQQQKLGGVNKAPVDMDALDIDAVLRMPLPPPVPHDTKARTAASADGRRRNKESSRIDATTARLCEPKGFALLRSKREPYEAVSSGGVSLAEKFLINHDKDSVGRDASAAIIENAVAPATVYAGGPPPHKISPRAAVLLADPYAIPTPRLHKAHDVNYVYRCLVDSWRVSPRRVGSIDQ